MTRHITDEQIEPCPLCGAQPGDDDVSVDLVECPSCGFKGPQALVIETATEAWNMRALAAPQGEPQRQAWAPYLVDRADGVKGHYAIGRWNPRGYREVWNLHKHCWAAFSDDVMSLEEADSLLRQITIPTAHTAPAPAPAPAVPSDERAALQRIADWSEHPPMLGVDYGSNGVRDYYRKIARAALTAAPTPPAQPAEGGEPLFILHCGQVDASGEQDEWEIEADSQKRVDDFCLQHPGQKAKLYTTPPASQERAKWAEYVAGMVDCWVNSEWPHYMHMDEDRRVKAIAGIIERRLWALKQQPAPAVQAVPEDVARVNKQMLDALEDLLECPYHIDEATVSKAGLEATMNANPHQVVGNMSVALLRVRKARAAIDAARAAENPRLNGAARRPLRTDG